MTAQDTRTPPIIDAIFEQITRISAETDNLVEGSDLRVSDEDNKEQVIADSSINYLRPPAELSDHKQDLRQRALTRREKKEQETRPQRLEKNHRLRVQHINSQTTHSPITLRQQLQASRSREQKSLADLLAAEEERKRLKSLISTLDVSLKKSQGREEIDATAKSRCTEAEATAVKLRADLKAALDRARNVQEQLNKQMKLASSKEHVIQSITKQSQVAHTKLKGAEDEIARLGAELRHEHDRWLCERKELLDERVKVQDSHEADIHRITQGAQAAQAELDALRDVQSRIRAHGHSSLDVVVYPPRCQPPTNEPVDTGQRLLPPERILDTGPRPLSPAIDPDPSLCSAIASQHSSNHDWGDHSTRRADYLLQISSCFDQVSDVAKAQRTALKGLLERICQLESENAQHVKLAESDRRHLEAELASTMEQLRLIDDEVLNLRRNLDQSRETTREVESHSRDLGQELDKCQAKLREAEGERQTSEIKYVQAVEYLRLRSAELESSRAEVESLKFKCSQATSLSATLQNRIYGLEAQVTTLQSTQRDSPATVAYISPPSFSPMDIGMRLP